MEAGSARDATLWAIEWARSPNPAGDARGLLSMALPWEEGDAVRAAVLVYESWPLAEAGLEHYLAVTGEHPSSYGVRRFSPSELIAALEGRPEGGGFDRVALNTIPSRLFPEAVSYSAGWPTEDFVAHLESLCWTNHG
jgi:hypothetical protein